MTFWRSGLIPIELKITSNFLASRAGMMPSQATSLISHWAFICSQSARIRSGSNPANCPEGVLSRKGG
ncbi:hypothetical protein D9M71_822940 [compost metagenome]